MTRTFSQPGSHLARRAVMLLAVVLLASGCSVTKWSWTGDDTSAKRQARYDDTVREFETRRDAAQYTSALSRWQMNDVDGCRASLEELIRRNPQHVDARLTLAELYLAEDEADWALQQVAAAETLLPQDARVAHLRGLAFESLGQHDAARTSFQQACTLEPTNELYQLSLQSCGEQTAVPPAVVQPAAHVAPTVAAAPGATAAVHAAVQALQNNQPAQALAALQPALAQWPEDATVHRTLGVAHYRQGDYAAAEVALRRSVSLDGSSPLSYFLLSATLEKLGSDDEAQRCRERASQLDPQLAALRK